MEVSIRLVNLDQALNDITRFESRLLKQLVKAVKIASEAGARKIKAEHFSGTSATSVRSRTGKLKKTVVAIPTTGTSNEVRGGISMGGNLPYAGVHIASPGKSTIITPKKGKFLAIPTQFARTASGIPRGGPRDPIWGATFIAQGMIFGYQRGTAREYSNPKPLFVLKRFVVVPSRIDPKRDVVSYIGPYLVKEVEKAVGDSVSVSVSVS